MIPFPDEAALPQPLQDELGKRRHLNVFRMLMHSPGVAPGFLAMTDALRSHNSLPADLMELAILRVGRRYGAVYETHHHERLARVAKAFAPAMRKPALVTSATVIIAAAGAWTRKSSRKSLGATGSISPFMSVISKCFGTIFVSISATACFVAPLC